MSLLSTLPRPLINGQPLQGDAALAQAQTTVQLASMAMSRCGRRADSDDALAVHALVVAAASVAGRQGSANAIALLSQARLLLTADAPEPARLWPPRCPDK